MGAGAQQQRERLDVVVSEPCGRGASLVPTLRTALSTLDISVRYLAATALGRATLPYGDRLLQGWVRDLFRHSSCSLSCVGREHIEPGRPYVVMSNHGSMADIPALIGTYPGTLRMVAKQELMRVPVWGRAMQASGFIPIDRHDRSRAIEQLELAKERLAQGVAVWIAPEGTRSPDGRLGPFKKGGFHLARQLGAGIVPAYVHGASQILPPHGVRTRHDVSVMVHYGKPIAADGDVAELVERVRAAILDLAGGRLLPRDR